MVSKSFSFTLNPSKPREFAIYEYIRTSGQFADALKELLYWGWLLKEVARTSGDLLGSNTNERRLPKATSSLMKAPKVFHLHLSSSKVRERGILLYVLAAGEYADALKELLYLGWTIRKDIN